MKKSMLKGMAVAIVLPFAFIGCENDNPLEGIDSEKVAVQFRATNGTVTKSAVQGETRALLFDNLVNITTFKINVGEIEFDFDDDDKWAYKFGGSYSYDDDIKLKGPFEIDLISKGTLQVKTLFTGLELPKAKFEEIEFKMKKNRDKNSLMYNQTIRIEGDILGIPFIFASDKEFDFEIEFDKPFIPGENLSVIVDFHVNQLFSHSLSGIDFSKAIDYNKNGIIEIYYNDDDNQSYNYLLGKKIWEWFYDIIDCDFDDDDDDDD